MNTQDGSGLWGYHDNAKSLCFQNPVDIKKSRRKKLSNFYVIGILQKKLKLFRIILKQNHLKELVKRSKMQFKWSLYVTPFPRYRDFKILQIQPTSHVKNCVRI